MTTSFLDDFLRDDAGTPLGRGVPSGSPLRTDGERHYDAWLRILRGEPCAYCGGPGGTVDHVEPRARAARGIGSAHSWLNVVGACARCNGAKRDRPLLKFLRERHTRNAKRGCSTPATRTDSRNIAFGRTHSPLSPTRGR